MVPGLASSHAYCQAYSLVAGWLLYMSSKQSAVMRSQSEMQIGARFVSICIAYTILMVCVVKPIATDKLQPYCDVQRGETQPLHLSNGEQWGHLSCQAKVPRKRHDKQLEVSIWTCTPRLQSVPVRRHSASMEPSVVPHAPQLLHFTNPFIL
jgi:hypothetical protein